MTRAVVRVSTISTKVYNFSFVLKLSRPGQRRKDHNVINIPNIKTCTVAKAPLLDLLINTHSGLSHYMDAAPMMMPLLKYIIGFGGKR